MINVKPELLLGLEGPLSSIFGFPVELLVGCLILLSAVWVYLPRWIKRMEVNDNV